jgi:poly(A)-specific ribonuclease
MKQLWIVRTISQTLTLASSSSARSFCSSSTFAIKNVTKSNFESSLRDLRQYVKEADFVAIDLEMTGVTSAPWRDSLEFDRFDIRYLKAKDSAEKFAVVQFGVCPFRYDHSKQSFVAYPHNFYVFPRQEVPVSGSYEFLCQTSSIDFLAKYQFDFNACIHEGISYLSRGQEDEALRRLSASDDEELSPSNFSDIREKPLTRMADILFTERMKIKMKEWREDLLHVKNGVSGSTTSTDQSNQQFQTIFFKMRPAVKLIGFTSHQLRLIKLVTQKHFKDLAYIKVTDDASFLQQLIVYTESKNDMDLLMKEVKDCLHKEAKMKIDSAIGFRHVIDLLASEKKLIVGHNSFLDIAHIYSKFLGQLPSAAEEYVSLVHKYFPHIIDTKVLLNENSTLQCVIRKNSTSLSKAFALLCPQIASGVKSSVLAHKPCIKVEVQVDDMRSSNWNSGAKHEAGYDAFMTGCIFAQACNHLSLDFEIKRSSLNLPNEEKLQKEINLLYLSWINNDIIDLKTGKQFISSSNSSNVKTRYSKIIFQSIVLIWGFPSKLKAADIKECLLKVFGLTSVTSIYHLDTTAVFVQFNKTELVDVFLELKSTLERNNDPISVLHPLSKILDGGFTRAANYESYIDFCSSPISKVLFADQADTVGIKRAFEQNLENEDGKIDENEVLDSLYAEEAQVGK